MFIFARIILIDVFDIYWRRMPSIRVCCLYNFEIVFTWFEIPVYYQYESRFRPAWY